MLPKLRNASVSNNKVSVNSAPAVTMVVNQGIIGPPGPAGVGVPLGGTTGQVLAKASDANYDTEWLSLSGLNYLGTWNAATNTPTLASGVGVNGGYYICNVAGNTNLDGITDWKVNDWAVFNGTVWQKIDNTESVTSVNGQTGAVVLTNTDVGAPSTTGTGATGTWAININGNAATATSATTAQTANNATTATSATTAATLSGVNPIANGGTGSTTANDALNALLPSQSGHAGQALVSTGTNAAWAILPISSGGTNQTSNGVAGQALISNGTGSSSWGTPGLATFSYDLKGGAANQLLVQTGVDATDFVAAPTTASTFLSWNGTSFSWEAAGGGSSLTGVTQSATPFKTALGTGAGTLSTGVWNTFVGYNAGSALTTGTGNTVMGFEALKVATSALSNVAIGYQAGNSTTSGSSNIFIGFQAGRLNTNSGNNTYIGAQTGEVTTGGNNTFIGVGVGAAATTIDSAVAIGGNNFGAATATGTVSIGFGSMNSLTTGTGNVGVGWSTGYGLTSGNRNTNIGYNSGRAHVTSNDNTMVGYQTGLVATGSENTCIGSQAGDAATTATGNTLVGFNAGGAVTTGGNNVLIGRNSGLLITTGSNNTIIGGYAGESATQSNYIILSDPAGTARMKINASGAYSFVSGGVYGSPGQTLRSQGTSSAPVWQDPNLNIFTQVSATNGIAPDDAVTFADASAGGFTLTLPSAITNPGLQLCVKRIDSVGANVLTIASAGGTIEGLVTQQLGPNVACIYCSDGANWWELANG